MTCETEERRFRIDPANGHILACGVCGCPVELVEEPNGNLLKKCNCATVDALPVYAMVDSFTRKNYVKAHIKPFFKVFLVPKSCDGVANVEE